MAKTRSFLTRAKKAKPLARRRRAGASTFIQRSRRVPSEEKAAYHTVTGAGRSHVLRKFFGLSADEGEQCRTLLERELGKRVEAMNR